jgi:hypothetical protein
MDYRLKKRYEQMLSNQRPLESSNKSLSFIYETEILTPPTPQQKLPVSDDEPSSDSVNADHTLLTNLGLISGITDETVLKDLYFCYEQIKNNSPELFDNTGFVIAPGGAGAYDTSAVLTLSELQKLVFEFTKDSESTSRCVITYAGDVRKIRTPLGQRIGRWSKINNNAVADLKNNLNSIKLKQRLAMRCLVILSLYEKVPGKIELKAKMPPGIKAENLQVDAFNKVIEKVLLGDSAIDLIVADDGKRIALPGGNKLTFDKAIKVPSTPKADIAFVKGDQQVFWISFKEGKHAVKDKEVAEFQQWGSFKTLYNADKNIKGLIDLFLTKSVETHPDSFRRFNKSSNWLKEIDVFLRENAKELVPKGGLLELEEVVNDIQQCSTVYVTLPAASMYADFISDSAKATNLKTRRFLETDLTNVALKTIFGKDYEHGKRKPFGVNNVNIVLETPQSIKAEIQMDSLSNEPSAFVLDSDSTSGHVLLNPDMPQSEKYFPCLYLRRTQKERFLFENPVTKQKELILCGRALFYTLGRAQSDAKHKESINIFS